MRITHLPTDIVVQCQNDRSQHRNRAEAMAMLKSRLYELELRKRQAEQQKLEDAKTDIGWGHQIRSYVLDQSRIKDLRTNVEVGNTQAVLDGDLDRLHRGEPEAGGVSVSGSERATFRAHARRPPDADENQIIAERRAQARLRCARKATPIRTIFVATRSPASCMMRLRPENATRSSKPSRSRWRSPAG